MNTERTEKFVNAIACDLEEGGFRQVSGTTLRRTLATAVSAALPLLEAGNPVSELAEQQGVREKFEAWLLTHTDHNLFENYELKIMWEAWQAARQPEGIDLGQFRPAALAYWSECKGQQMNAVGGPFAQQNAAAEKVKEAERLLALIDQRDAAPGVSS